MTFPNTGCRESPRENQSKKLLSFTCAHKGSYYHMLGEVGIWVRAVFELHSLRILCHGILKYCILVLMWIKKFSPRQETSAASQRKWQFWYATWPARYQCGVPVIKLTNNIETQHSFQSKVGVSGLFREASGVDEELRSASIGLAGVGHRQCPWFIAIIWDELILTLSKGQTIPRFVPFVSI